MTIISLLSLNASHKLIIGRDKCREIYLKAEAKGQDSFDKYEASYISVENVTGGVVNK